MNESLTSYTGRFFGCMPHHITNEDVIHCFQNGLLSKHTYHDFERNTRLLSWNYVI
jgi:hypothetical protein